MHTFPTDLHVFRQKSKVTSLCVRKRDFFKAAIFFLEVSIGCKQRFTRKLAVFKVFTLFFLVNSSPFFAIKKLWMFAFIRKRIKVWNLHTSLTILSVAQCCSDRRSSFFQTCIEDGRAREGLHSWGSGCVLVDMAGLYKILGVVSSQWPVSKHASSVFPQASLSLTTLSPRKSPALQRTGSKIATYHLENWI